MHIVFTIGSLELGGAENQMLMLIQGLVSQQYHCEVAVLDSRGPHRKRLEQLNVCVHDLGYRSEDMLPIRLSQIVRGVFRLCRLAITRKPDVVQGYLPLTNFMGALAGTVAGTRTVITCRRGLGTHQDRHKLWALFDRITNRLSTIVTANSEAVRQDTIARDGITPDKITLIANGLDFESLEVGARGSGAVRKELEIGEEEVSILSVGNLIPYKGYADLIEAVALLQTTLPQVRFFIAGRDDGIGPSLEEQRRELNIADTKIKFLGERRDVPQLMAAMDLFVMPSHEEGFSNALLEAMAAGLPVIATNVGGNPEALQNGQFGTLVEPRDPVALSGAIAEAATSLKQARKRGRIAAEYVRNKFTVNAMVHAHIALYQACNRG